MSIDLRLYLQKGTLQQRRQQFHPTPAAGTYPGSLNVQRNNRISNSSMRCKRRLRKQSLLGVMSSNGGDERTARLMPALAQTIKSFCGTRGNGAKQQEG
jgi:hypothetical protein